MTGTFTNNGDGTTTVTFEYTAITARVNASITDAAHYFWLAGDAVPGVQFTSLTPTQRLAIVDLRVKAFILDSARAYRTNLASDEAIADALALAETEIGLNGG